MVIIQQKLYFKLLIRFNVMTQVFSWLILGVLSDAILDQTLTGLSQSEFSDKWHRLLNILPTTLILVLGILSLALAHITLLRYLYLIETYIPVCLLPIISFTFRILISLFFHLLLRYIHRFLSVEYRQIEHPPLQNAVIVHPKYRREQNHLYWHQQL